MLFLKNLVFPNIEGHKDLTTLSDVWPGCSLTCHGLFLVPLPLLFCSSVFCWFCTFPVLFCILILDSSLPALVFPSCLITCTCPSLVHSPVSTSLSATLYISVPFLCSVLDCSTSLSVSVRQCGIPVFFSLFLWTLFPVYLIVPVLPTYLHVSLLDNKFFTPATCLPLSCVWVPPQSSPRNIIMS